MNLALAEYNDLLKKDVAKLKDELDSCAVGRRSTIQRFVWLDAVTKEWIPARVRVSSTSRTPHDSLPVSCLSVHPLHPIVVNLSNEPDLSNTVYRASVG